MFSIIKLKQGSVVRKVDSAIHRIVSFSTAIERHKKQYYDINDIELAKIKISLT